MLILVIETLCSMTVSAIIISMPILCTLSFVYSWNDFIQAALTVATLAEYFILTFILHFID